ncbi:unnamed protein product [Ilex paraguariensis]|uniref:Uncharacterized protein n=1 Tax=Ilex paraguariensis TaxID=185542 RepID=A0ABC8TCR7_9AQUA
MLQSREGAEMLLYAGFFASFRVLFDGVSDDRSLSVIQSERSLSNSSEKIEKSRCIWGLGLAVVTAMIHSLGGSFSGTGVVDHVMAYFFLEKSDVIYYYLNALDFPSDDHDKKRAGHERKEFAFISRGVQHLGESPNRITSMLCHPILKEEFEWYKKPSFIESRNGWFALSAFGCGLNPKFSALSSQTTALVIKNQATGEDAAKRAEAVGFVDLAHFPEPPMPNILHGLQDQGIVMVTELCEANKFRQVSTEKLGVCILPLQITVMALYLEFCVSQICGIRPVLGRVEDFSKELEKFLRG